MTGKQKAYRLIRNPPAKLTLLGYALNGISLLIGFSANLYVGLNVNAKSPVQGII